MGCASAMLLLLTLNPRQTAELHFPSLGEFLFWQYAGQILLVQNSAFVCSLKLLPFCLTEARHFTALVLMLQTSALSAIPVGFAVSDECVLLFPTSKSDPFADPPLRT